MIGRLYLLMHDFPESDKTQSPATTVNITMQILFVQPTQAPLGRPRATPHQGKLWGAPPPPPLLLVPMCEKMTNTLTCRFIFTYA